MKKHIAAVSSTALQLALLSTLIALALGINYLSAWTGPSALPTGNNVAAPINVGTTNQVKDGNFSVGSSTNVTPSNGINPLGITVLGSQRIDGWLKVGDGATGNPSQPLELTGTAGTDGIKFPDGTVQVTAGGGGGGTPIGVGTIDLNVAKTFLSSDNWKYIMMDAHCQQQNGGDDGGSGAYVYKDSGGAVQVAGHVCGSTGSFIVSTTEQCIASLFCFQLVSGNLVVTPKSNSSTFVSAVAYIEMK